jgi:hypothetical protein
MFLAGLGIGPTLSVFTIVIQSSVPFSRLGVATGNLTFFRQIGGSIGLAMAGTIFADSFSSRLEPSLAEAGVPSETVVLVQRFSGTQGDLTQVTDTTLAHQLAQVPPLQGLVDQIVAGVYQAFSTAVGDTFWFGLVVTLIALLAVGVGLRDVPLRHADQVPVEGDVDRQPSPDAKPTRDETT